MKWHDGLLNFSVTDIGDIPVLWYLRLANKVTAVQEEQRTELL